MQTHHINRHHNSVDVSVGDEVAVELEELAAAGYQWRPLAGALFRVVVDEFEGPDSGVPGSAALRRFRLRAERAGSDEIGFDLVRPWQPTEVASSIRVGVRVSAHHT